jgi:pimeloyl-ACP methyl ester carboxylesterase
MTLGRSTVWLAGLAAAVLQAAGCARLPQVEYRLPGTALVPFAAAGIEDRSAEFGGLFCSVLRQVGTQEGSWGGCGDYIETPGSAQRDLASLPTDYRVLVVPGLLGQCLSPGLQAFSDALAHLRDKHGLTAEYLDVPAMGSCERNAEVIANHLRERLTADPRKYIVVGYSKGGCDLMVMLATYPEVREAVAALVTVAAPVGGSRALDLTPDWVARSLENLKMERCEMGDAGGLKSLRRSARQAFLSDHPRPLVPTYSLVAVSTKETTSRGLRSFWRKLSSFSLDQDGQVIASEGIPAGARFLGVLKGDHWAIAMPFEHAEHALLRRFADHNHFPRTVLLEATIRIVVDDLTRQAASCHHGSSRDGKGGPFDG